ncbi:GNAT family N-acetyltransferase [Catellatospora bangladeshensis]|uniref:N-acetyltransferase n=1 Tax=Catellatospora bangladeshensis TaxID=310355 RepID=A0A8J3NI56_9ACTN|nr:GNAT family N-acetyltransferase [Catellatospora bangladeshensis]GIF79976.1 N-acetyltransferase [Catellatospora bangladeshensis]
MINVVIRPVTALDEPRWRELWDAYTRFYEREPVEEITRHTWARIMDEHAPVYAIVAESGGEVVGIANYLLHESTSALAPVCYLQDLFVDPAARTRGVGGLLIDRLWELTRANGWSRLYWQTRENNYRARALYDRYTPHSGFLRYVLSNPDAA